MTRGEHLTASEVRQGFNPSVPGAAEEVLEPRIGSAAGLDLAEASIQEELQKVGHVQKGSSSGKGSFDIKRIRTFDLLNGSFVAGFIRLSAKDLRKLF